MKPETTKLSDVEGAYEIWNTKKSDAEGAYVI